MTIDILLLIIILIAALVLFTFEWFSADITALGILVALILLGLLPVDEALAGFGSETVLMMLGLLILTAALMNTGVVDMAGRYMLRLVGQKPERLLSVTMLSGAGLSVFISNTAATAFLLPVILGIGRRARSNISRLLLPLAFASIMASSVTLISTSTNIVVSGMMMQSGLKPIGMLELTPVGLPILITGLLYMLLIGQRLIPDRAQNDTAIDHFGLRPYLTEMIVRPDSPLVGQTLSQANLRREIDLTILGLERGDEKNVLPSADEKLLAGDILYVEGSHEAIMAAQQLIQFQLVGDSHVSADDLQTKNLHLVEVVLLPRSPFIGRTLRGLRLREEFDIQVMAVSRHSGTIRNRIAQTRLRMGDVLLVQAQSETIADLKEQKVFDVLGVLGNIQPNFRRAPLSIGIFVFSLALAAFNLMPIAVAVLLGSLLVFLTRCITPEEAYREVEWKAIILIACMLALGAAMVHTGAAQFLASWLVKLVGNWSAIGLLTIFFLLSVLLTQPMSNQAAAAVILPIAIQTALQLGLNPRPFAILIAVAASTSYLTPLEPACLMVYGPGHYRFSDFLRVGAPLTFVIYLIAIILVPLIWPLR